MKKSVFLILLLCSFGLSYGQIKYHSNIAFDENQQEVLEVILKLFDSMRESDSAKLHTVFDDDVRMYTSFTDQEGNPKMHQGSLEQFLTAIGSPHPQVYDEPLWNIDIKIDDNLATVWTEYAFYLDKQFSHCGVDAFMLHKIDGEWKIYFLTDTRRKTGCEVPDEIKEMRTL